MLESSSLPNQRLASDPKAGILGTLRRLGLITPSFRPRPSYYELASSTAGHVAAETPTALFPILQFATGLTEPDDDPVQHVSFPLLLQQRLPSALRRDNREPVRLVNSELCQCSV